MGTSRSASLDFRTTRAFAASITAPRSPLGSQWVSEPPIVPRLRTSGSAICGAAAAIMGYFERISSDPASWLCRTKAPSTQIAVLFLDRVEALEPVDVDQMPRRGEPQLHHRDQALSAGEDLRLVAEGGEHIERLSQRGRPVILETGRQHRGPSSFGWLSALSPTAGGSIHLSHGWRERATQVQRASVPRCGPVVDRARPLLQEAAAAGAPDGHDLGDDRLRDLLGTFGAQVQARRAVDARAVLVGDLTPSSRSSISSRSVRAAGPSMPM